MKVLNPRRRSFNSQIMTFERSRARASSRGHISAIAKVLSPSPTYQSSINLSSFFEHKISHSFALLLLHNENNRSGLYDHAIKF